MAQMDYEKIKYSIFESGKLTISVMSLPNYKNKNNSLISKIRSRRYDSNKYVDRSQLEELQISTGDYVCIEYFDFKENGGTVKDELVFSYNKLGAFIKFISEVKSYIVNNYNNIYTENGINPEIVSPFTLDELAKDYQNNSYKGIGILPVMIPSQRYEGFSEKGIAIFLGNPSASVASEMSLDGFMTMVDILIEQIGTPGLMKSRLEFAMTIGYLQKMLTGGGAPTSMSSTGSTFTSNAQRNSGSTFTNPWNNGSQSVAGSNRSYPTNTSVAGNTFQNNATSGFPGSNNRPIIDTNRTVPNAPVTPEPTPEVEKVESLDDLSSSINSTPVNTTTVGSGGIMDDILANANSGKYDSELEDEIEI